MKIQEEHGLVLTWGNKKVDYSTSTHIKLYFFPSEISLAFSKAMYGLFKKKGISVWLVVPSVACAGTHHSWQENIAQGILSSRTVTQPRGCAATVPAAHLPPACLWHDVLKGNSPPSQTELGAIRAALLPQNNESPLRGSLMRSKFLSGKIKDDPMMSCSFPLLLPSGRR